MSGLILRLANAMVGRNRLHRESAPLVLTMGVTLGLQLAFNHPEYARQLLALDQEAFRADTGLEPDVSNYGWDTATVVSNFTLAKLQEATR